MADTKRDELRERLRPEISERVASIGFGAANGGYHEHECAEDTEDLLDAVLALLEPGWREREEETCKLIEGFADNIEELAFRIPAPNEHTPEFVTYANAMRFIAQKRREALRTPQPKSEGERP